MQSKIETEALKKLRENTKHTLQRINTCSKKEKQPPTFALKCPCCGKETRYYAKLNAFAKLEVKSQKSEGVFQLETKLQFPTKQT